MVGAGRFVVIKSTVVEKRLHRRLRLRSLAAVADHAARKIVDCTFDGEIRFRLTSSKIATEPITSRHRLPWLPCLVAESRVHQRINRFIFRLLRTTASL